ncbi:hypothetical protein D3C80_902430 [compost metagenome]
MVCIFSGSVEDVAIPWTVWIHSSQIGFAAGIGRAELHVWSIHKRQAGLVLKFPGLLPRSVEVGVLLGIAQIKEGTVILDYIIKGRVAVDFLQAQSQALASARERQTTTIGVIVDPSELTLTLIAGFEIVQIRRQRQYVGQLQ